MDAFVFALDTKDVSEFGRSLYYTIKRHETLSMSELNGVIDSVSLIQRRVINHQSDTSKKMKSLNKQNLQDKPLVTYHVGDKLLETLFKGTREFSAKSYAQAFKLVAMTHGKEKAVIAIDRTYGIATSDTAALKEMMNKLRAKIYSRVRILCLSTK
jgi:Mn-containing catalase